MPTSLLVALSFLALLGLAAMVYFGLAFPPAKKKPPTVVGHAQMDLALMYEFESAITTRSTVARHEEASQK